MLNWVYNKHKMKKLIAKSQLLNQSDFEYRLQSVGMELGPTVWQHERIYLPSDWQYGRNMPRLVLRTEVYAVDQPAFYSIYLKRHIEDSGIDIVDLTSVGDYTEAANIIHQLGFRKTAEVSRQRRELSLDSHTAIYLDQVEGVHDAFVKIEAEVKDGDHVEALKVDLLNTLAMLGQKTYTEQPYFDLMKNDMQAYLLPSSRL